MTGRSGISCAVPQCNCNKIDNPDVTFFKIPTADETRWRKWLENARCEHLINTHHIGTIRFCSRHFEENCFTNAGRKRLTRVAVPTIFPQPLSCGEWTDEQPNSPGRKQFHHDDDVSLLEDELCVPLSPLPQAEELYHLLEGPSLMDEEPAVVVDDDSNDNSELEDDHFIQCAMALSKTCLSVLPIERTTVLYRNEDFVIEEPWMWQEFHEVWQQTVPFTGAEPGPSKDALDTKSAADLLGLFFSPAVVETIARETNHSGEQAQRKRPWNSVATEDVLAFIGVALAMGVISRQAVSEYWSNNPILGHNWFRSVMSHRRFLDIWRYFKVVSAREDDAAKCLQPLIDSLKTSVPKHYVPHQQMSVDEQLIGTRCNVSFPACPSVKPLHFNTTLHVLADTHNGYILNFTTDDICGSEVVLELVKTFVGNGYQIYMDDFYTSPSLVKELLAENIYSCGLCRRDVLNYPDKLEMSTGAVYSGSVSAFEWQGHKRDATLLSSFHTCRSAAVTDYNKHMNGSQLADRCLLSCVFCLQTKKWKRLMWRLLDVAVTCAYALEKWRKPMLTEREFRLELAAQLVQPLIMSTPTSTGVPQREDVHIRITRDKRSRCQACPRKHNCNTRVYCSKCQKYMCIKQFDTVHRRQVRDSYVVTG